MSEDGEGSVEKKDVTIRMPIDLVEAIDEDLKYGDSRAGWIRDAIRDRLERQQSGEGDSGNVNLNPQTAD